MIIANILIRIGKLAIHNVFKIKNYKQLNTIFNTYNFFESSTDLTKNEWIFNKVKDIAVYAQYYNPFYKNYYKENKLKLRQRYYENKEKRELQKSRLYKLFLDQTLESTGRYLSPLPALCLPFEPIGILFNIYNLQF